VKPVRFRYSGADLTSSDCTVTGLVQDPAVFERFTEHIESGRIPLQALPSSSTPITQQVTLSTSSSTSSPSIAGLSKSDIATILSIHQELHKLCSIAAGNGVRIAFDAEQSWYQPALNRIVNLLAKEFNRSPAQGPIIFNTYQANLTDTEKAIKDDLARAKAEGGQCLR
jgi:proline dehydrogenase